MLSGHKMKQETQSLIISLRVPLFYAVVIFVLLAWPLLSPKILLPADLLWMTSVSKPAHNSLLSDTIEQHYPYQHFSVPRLAKGDCPYGIRMF